MMPDMRSEPGHDQPTAGPAAPHPGSSRTGRRVRGQACDVTSEPAVAGLIDRVLADRGRLDVLVTSAGIQARGTIDELGVAALRACLEVNVVGTWLACRAAAAPMRAAGYPGRRTPDAGIDDDPQARHFLAAEIPLGRWAEPAELAGAALLLTDPASMLPHRRDPARGRRLDRPLNPTPPPSTTPPTRGEHSPCRREHS